MPSSFCFLPYVHYINLVRYLVRSNIFLASIYCAHSTAEELHMEVMKRRTTVLGQEHPDMLRSMASLALFQGRRKEAQMLQEQARKEILEQVLETEKKRM